MGGRTLAHSLLHPHLYIYIQIYTPTCASDAAATGSGEISEKTSCHVRPLPSSSLITWVCWFV